MSEINITNITTKEEREEGMKLTPQEFFDKMKGCAETMTDDHIQRMYRNAVKLNDSFKVTGQIEAQKKLQFEVQRLVINEMQLINMGIDKYIDPKEIKEFIKFTGEYIKTFPTDAKASRVFPVKIIELEKYPRLIPDEIVEVIAKTKDLFDQMYVLYTDYNGEVEAKIKKEKRDKDPILFGGFNDNKKELIIPRLYFLGDWVDEYCDLTLSKMINIASFYTKEEVVKTLTVPTTIKEFEKTFDITSSKESKNKKQHTINNDSGLFDRVRTFFGWKKN